MRSISAARSTEVPYYSIVFYCAYITSLPHPRNQHSYPLLLQLQQLVCIVCIVFLLAIKASFGASFLPNASLPACRSTSSHIAADGWLGGDVHQNWERKVASCVNFVLFISHPQRFEVCDFRVLVISDFLSSILSSILSSAIFVVTLSSAKLIKTKFR